MPKSVSFIAGPLCDNEYTLSTIGIDAFSFDFLDTSTPQPHIPPKQVINRISSLSMYVASTQVGLALF